MEHVLPANQEAFTRLTEADPVLVDVRPAGEVVPGMTPDTILTSGAPLSWEAYHGGQRRAVLHAAVYEELAASPELRVGTEEFDLLVAEAIDRLPEDFQRLLDTTPVVVSQHGAENRAYGHYFGDTVARDDYPDRIVLYQDTLERDFGHDPELLRAQVERTLRHELAHHLGWGEPGVRDLGL